MKCDRCNGMGSIIVSFIEVNCPKCGGTGKDPLICSECKDSGAIVRDVGGGLLVEVTCSCKKPT